MTAPPVQALAACLARHGVARLGVAVSGGGDSLAVLAIAVDVLGAQAVAAVTVDHGLRAASATEATGVGAVCARLGVAHTILHWQAPARGNLQAAARAGRRALIGAWAQDLGLDAVALGHTRDDQAETVLMALARAAGVDGLSAMPEALEDGSVLWLRPFLGVTRAALRAELIARGLTWVDDPTNADPAYERVRMRRVLAGAGLEGAHLAALAARMQAVRAALDLQTDHLLAAHVRADRGTFLIAQPAFALPAEARARLILRLIGHRDVRRAALARWLDAGCGTLAGWVLRPQGDAARLYREAASVATLRAPVGAVWDRRWTATGPAPTNAQIAALGATGLRILSAQAGAGLHPHPRQTGLPRAVLAGLPAIWRDDVLLAAPLGGWPNGWTLHPRPLAAPDSVTELSH